MRQHIQEGLSKAYVSAIAHRAGFGLSKPEFDYGIDGTVTEITRLSGRYSESGYKLDYQLKASVNVTKTGGEIVFPLEAKNYNDLVEEFVGTPRILIVYSMPQDEGVWLETSGEALILRHCAWWISLKGKEKTTNTDTKTVHIPEANILDVEGLKSLMALVKNGGLS